MILVALGIIFGIILYKWWMYHIERPDRHFSLSLGIFLVMGFVIFIIVGLSVPVAGYEEPELVETRTLYPITSTALVENTNQNTYLVAYISNDRSRKSNNIYWYSVEKNGKIRTEREYGDVRVSYEETDTPIIESYIKRAKKTLFSLNIATTEEYFIVRAPQTGVQLKYKDV